MSKSKVTTSKPKIALVFPGQGSQHVGMGLDLYEASPVAQEVFDQADKILGFPLSRLCFEGPLEELSQTINTQPAILAASVASLRLAMEAGLNLEDVSYVAGHSLGEYTALVAGRAMEFHHALDLVRERGRLMQEAAVENPGGMAAILGLELETVVQVCDAFGVQIANINCPGQIVISGDLEALEQASEMAKEKGARRVMPLEVRGAYHSNLMRRALR
ncbi:MAG: ACP S-malonyltransferase, partial [Chloroflexota bacterium]